MKKFKRAEEEIEKITKSNISRIHITAPELLIARVIKHCNNEDEPQTQSEFCTKALLNQLEREGDYEIRDLLDEGEIDNE